MSTRTSFKITWPPKQTPCFQLLEWRLKQHAARRKQYFLLVLKHKLMNFTKSLLQVDFTVFRSILLLYGNIIPPVCQCNALQNETQFTERNGNTTQSNSTKLETTTRSYQEVQCRIRIERHIKEGSKSVLRMAGLRVCLKLPV